MSTNATITVVNRATGKASTIYNHYDGYPSHLLKLLEEHYNTQERADALVALGDVSVLKESIECSKGHTFETPVDGCSIFYGRDRGERNTQAYVQDINTFWLEDKQSYNYMFVDGIWIQSTKIPNLHERVLLQLKKDVAADDFTAIFELLQYVPDVNLEAFLSE